MSDSRPLSLQAEVQVVDGIANSSVLRVSEEVADLIGYDDQRENQCCVLIGQGVRFPSWNHVHLPVEIEIEGRTAGLWVQIPRKLRGLDLLDLDQPWELLVVPMVEAEQISVVLDPAARDRHGRGARSDQSSADLQGKRFVVYPGNEVRIGDLERGREAYVDSAGSWPWRVQLRSAGPSEITVYAVGDRTDISYREGAATRDRKVSLVVLVDCSGSMDDKTSSGQSRLRIARGLLYDAFNEALAAESWLVERCAIVGYGANIVRIFPETTTPLGRFDAVSADQVINGVRHLHSGLLDHLGLDRHLSDMPLALLYAGYLLEEAEDLGHRRQIVLVTDGESEEVFEAVDELGNGWKDRSSNIARQLYQKLGIFTSTILIQDGEPSPDPVATVSPARNLPGEPPSSPLTFGRGREEEVEPSVRTSRSFNSPVDRRARLKAVASEGQGESCLYTDEGEVTRILIGS